MSTEKRQTVKEIEQVFKDLTKKADDAGKRASTLGDKDLVKKIQKVKENSDQVVEHIEKRTEK